MKNLVITLSLVFSVFAATAQDRAAAPEKKQPLTVEQKIEKAMSKLTQQLSLTSAQEKQSRTYITGFYTEQEKIASLKQTDKKEYVEKLKAKAEGYLVDIKKVLNAEQNKIFATMVDKFREKHENKN
jgi:hypothetical protein